MITVVTPTLPERAPLLAQLADCMARQTLAPQQWLIEWDYTRRGTVAVVNDLARHVTTPWLFPFADDDLLEHDHFDTLKPYLTDDADIVYTWCRVEGVKIHGRSFQTEFDPDRLRNENYIPAPACIRTDLWRQLGGYRARGTFAQRGGTEHEDWDFWLRALDVGARFRCVPIVTWTYRMNADWAHVSI